MCDSRSLTVTSRDSCFLCVMEEDLEGNIWRLVLLDLDPTAMEYKGSGVKLVGACSRLRK